MPTSLLIALAFTTCAVIALVGAERAASQLGVGIAKPLASLGFIAVACAAGALDSSYGRTLLCGLVACALGDVLLIPKGTGPAFLAGTACFGVGHAAYGLAFASLGLDRTAMLVAGVPMLGVAVATLRWLNPTLPQGLRAPVIGYLSIISAMVVLAVGASVHLGHAALSLGPLAFALSDLSVARERFVKPAFVNQAWGLPLYYAAQVAIVCIVPLTP